MPTKLLFNRALSVTIHRQKGNPLFISMEHVDTWCEKTARLFVNPRFLDITGAEFETYRSPGNQDNGVLNVPQLTGINCFVDPGRRLQQALATVDTNGYMKELFLEGVRALLQGQAYIVHEKGLSAAQLAEKSAHHSFAMGDCRRSANIDPDAMADDELIKAFLRTSNVFTRHRFSSLYETENGFQAQVKFCDSFHEMSIRLDLGRDLRITNAQANILRPVRTLCLEADAPFNRLKGLTLRTEARRDYHQVAAGPEGCTHLANLVVEAARTLELHLKGYNLGHGQQQAI